MERYRKNSSHILFKLGDWRRNFNMIVKFIGIKVGDPNVNKTIDNLRTFKKTYSVQIYYLLLVAALLRMIEIIFSASRVERHLNRESRIPLRGTVQVRL